MTWVSASAMRRSRGQIKTQVYDWAAEGDFTRSRKSKIRRAAQNCIISGAGAYATTKLAGGSDDVAAVNFAGACAVAAVTPMLNP